MHYQKSKHYLVLTIDDKFNNHSILELLETYNSSKKLIHQLRMSKDIFLNDEMISQNFNIRLKNSDILKLPIFSDEEIDFIPQDIPIDIIYEDEFILIVNKQADLEIHPDSKTGLNTLVNGISNYYHKTNQAHRIRYIHRLDRDTTGIVVFAKNYFTHCLFDKLLEQKLIKRYYLALVEGRFINKQGIINKKIGRDRHHNQRRIISNTGDEAKTAYRLIQENSNYSLVELELFTGRTHQIRVHLASISHPIIGDELYGNPSNLINRCALHADKVQLVHPVTLQPFIVEAPIPQDFKILI